MPSIVMSVQTFVDMYTRGYHAGDVFEPFERMPCMCTPQVAV